MWIAKSSILLFQVGTVRQTFELSLKKYAESWKHLMLLLAVVFNQGCGDRPMSQAITDELLGCIENFHFALSFHTSCNIFEMWALSFASPCHNQWLRKHFEDIVNMVSAFFQYFCTF